MEQGREIQTVKTVPPAVSGGELMVVQNEAQLDAIVNGAKLYLRAQDTIRKTAILLTNQNDWCDQNGTPYLEWSGAAKIRGAFGVSVKDLFFEEDKRKDDKGDYIIFSAMANFLWKNQETSEIGTASSRDAFFAKRKGVLLPLSEIDLQNIKKKAHTNLLNRGIKSLLGLTFTWAEVEQYSTGKVKRGGVATVTYKAGSKGGGSGVITDAQRKRLFAISKGKNVSGEKMKEILKFKGYESSKDIKTADYDDVVKMVEELS